MNAKSTVVLDEYTLQINLEQPFVGFLSILNKQSMAAISPKAVIENSPYYDVIPKYTANDTNNDSGMIDLDVWFPELAGNYSLLGLTDNHTGTNSGVVPGSSFNTELEHTWFQTHQIGTGPFILTELSSQQITLDRNDNWWNAPNFHPDVVDQVVIKRLSSSAGSDYYLPFDAGDADFASLFIADSSKILYNIDGVIQLINGEVLPYEAEKFQTFVYPRYRNRAFFFNFNESLPNTIIKEESNSLYGWNATGYDCRDPNVLGNTSTDAASGCRFRELAEYNDLNNQSTVVGAQIDNPFTSLLFRQAFAYAVDYDKVIATAYKGLAYPMSGVIPTGMFGYNGSLIPNGNLPSYQPVVVKALLEQVGWKGSISFTYMGGNMFLRDLFLDLKETIEGFALDIYLHIFELNFPFPYKPNYEFYPIIPVGWGADYPDPHNFVQAYFHSTKGYYTKANHYFNPLLDEMIDTAVSETDSASRNIMYSNIEIAAAADYAMIYVADLFDVKIGRTWTEDIQGSGALNPVFSALFQWAYIGKAETWQNDPIIFQTCFWCDNSTTYPDSTSLISTTNSVTTPISQITVSMNLFSLNLLFTMISGGIGGIGGILFAIVIRRTKK